ncbi:hypothetical protein BH09SUM1_BH09SUM1_20460 [soil metagenome]
MFSSAFHEYVVQGGFMMFFLVPTAVMMVAFIIQSLVNLRKERLAPAGFANQLRAARSQAGEGGMNVLLNESDHSLAEVLKGARERLSYHPELNPQEVLKEEIQRECDRLIQQNSQLAIIYRIGPQMGLLGTTSGMISAFSKFAQTANPKVQDLSIGIYMALITTAWGLGISIPAYFMFYLYQRRISNYEQLYLPEEAWRCWEIIEGDSIHRRAAQAQQRMAVRGA